MGLKYGFCINHPTRYAVNAKHLCAQCAKERNIRISESKGFTIQKKDDELDSTRGYNKICFQKHKTISKTSPIDFKKSKIKYLSEKGKVLAKQELLMFKKIWESRPHFCEVTGKPIYAFDVRCFSHVLTKGAYGRFRLYEKNIVLCLPEKHFEWEFGTRKTLELSWIETLESALKTEYYKL